MSSARSSREFLAASRRVLSLGPGRLVSRSSVVASPWQFQQPRVSSRGAGGAVRLGPERREGGGDAICTAADCGNRPGGYLELHPPGSTSACQHARRFGIHGRPASLTRPSSKVKQSRNPRKASGGAGCRGWIRRPPGCLGRPVGGSVGRPGPKGRTWEGAARDGRLGGSDGCQRGRDRFQLYGRNALETPSL